jgi:peptidoglycan hydrolase-like protein with peptidoglycan-binding domain
VNWDEHFRRVSRRSAPASFGADFGASAAFGGPGGDPNVLAVQRALNKLGVQPPLVTDGQWGPHTQTAVTAYQARVGLRQSSVIDAPTLKSLGITPQKLAPLPTYPLLPIPGLKQIVVESFPAFTLGFEGHTPYPYTDIKGYVTVGDGNKIDPLPLALALPWTLGNAGPPASPSQVTADFNTLKANYAAKTANGGKPPSAAEQQSLTTIRLSDLALATLMASKLADNHRSLTAQYPNIASWPADGQMAAHSVSWAWGPSFANVWNRISPGLGDAFKSAVAALDFSKAAQAVNQADQYEITHNANTGMAPRAAANQTLLTNAQAAVSGNTDPNSLFYPNTFWAGLGAAVLAAPAQALAFAGKHVGLSVGTLGLIALVVGGLVVVSNSRANS